jgi:hypothetical protein
MRESRVQLRICDVKIHKRIHSPLHNLKTLLTAPGVLGRQAYMASLERAGRDVVFC